MTTASHSLATALWRARFASGLLECGYTTNRDTTVISLVERWKSGMASRNFVINAKASWLPRQV